MLFIKIIRFFLGYVRFSVIGDFPERFLNLVTNSNLRIWGMKRIDGKLCGYAVAKDYRNIRSFARKSRVRAKIDRKYGFPFFIERYKARVGFFVGIAVFALTLTILSLSIWSIEISGNSLVSDREIEKTLAQNGLKLGTFGGQIDEVELAQKIVMQIKDLSYATIFIRGSVAEVQVREVSKTMQSDDENPQNIVADCKGKIISIDAYAGTASVKVGDTVTKGDILISGVEENSIANHLVFAKGKVIAECEENISASVLKNQTVQRLEKPYRRRSANFFSLKLPLFIGRLPDDEYKIFEANQSLTLFGRKMPLGFDMQYHYRLHTEKADFTKEESERLCRAIVLLKEMMNFKKGEIISEKLTLKEQNNGYEVTKHCVFNKNIGVGVKIGYDENGGENSAE